MVVCQNCSVQLDYSGRVILVLYSPEFLLPHFTLHNGQGPLENFFFLRRLLDRTRRTFPLLLPATSSSSFSFSLQPPHLLHLSQLSGSSIALSTLTRTMADHHQDFNSSDIEFSPVQQRFANAGESSVASMRNTLFEDRVTSKKRLRTLTDSRGAPATQYMRNLWMNRLESYMKNNNLR